MTRQNGARNLEHRVCYTYSLLILVDTSIAAGGGLGVSGEGPGIFFYPTEEQALAFARELCRPRLMGWLMIKVGQTQPSLCGK